MSDRVIEQAGLVDRMLVNWEMMAVRKEEVPTEIKDMSWEMGGKIFI